jgi:PAS domain S-box-containing protein
MRIIIDEHQAALEYDLMKYKLTSRALGIAHWDMVLTNEDPLSPENITTYSDEFRAMLGFSGEEDFPNLLSSWGNQLAPEDFNWVLRAFLDHLNDRTGKTPFDLEYPLLLKNGETRYFHAFGSTVRDKYGGPVRIAGAMEDITERKRQEEGTREADERTQVLLNATPLGINFWNEHMQNISANDETVRLFGLSRKQEYFERFGELSPEFQPDGERSTTKGGRLVREAFQNGYSRVEWMHRLLDGQPFPCEVTFIRVKYKDGYAVAGYTRDLRKEKEMLGEIQAAKAKSEAAAHWYKSILDAVPLPISVTDTDMNWTFVNAAVERFLGVQYEDMLGKHCSGWDADICNTDRCGIACAKRGLKQTYFHHNGSSYQVDVEMLENLDGEVEGFIEIVQDITKIEALTKKQLEAEEAQRSFNILASVMNGIDAMLYVTDPKTNEILFINDKMIDYYGIEGDCVGMPCYQVFHKDKNAACDVCPCFQLDKEPDKIIVWEELHTPNGSILRNSDRYIEWPDGRIAHLQYSVDVTDLKNATYALDQRLEQQAIMTSVSQNFLYAKDIDALITDTFCRIGTFLEIDQLLLFVMEADEHYFTCQNEWINPSFDMPTRIGREFSFNQSAAAKSLTIKYKDRKAIYMTSEDPDVREVIGPYRTSFYTYLIIPIFLGDRLYALLDFSRDDDHVWSQDDVNMAAFLSSILTGAFQRQSVERQLIAAKELAERNSRYKSSFLATMSHEIRTPINAILGIAEIQLQEQALSADMEEAFNRIYDSGDLLLNIINDILDLSKIEAGKLELVPVKYDVPSLIHDTVQLNRLRHESSRLDLVLQVDGDTPLDMMGDELRIKQVLNNLLSNAFKYTERGRIGLSVSAEPGREAPDAGEFGDVTLVLEISDTGRGMTEEQIGKLFDEYTRFHLEANRTTVGTGLGMSITKRLVDLMGGEISVESRLGKGTAFTVHLPQKRVSRAVCGTEMTDILQRSHYKSLTKAKKAQIIRENMSYGSVLVVDDVESNLYVAKGLLLPYGLKIETASSGFEAIDAIQDGRVYDVIFMDHMMPVMDGIEAANVIRGMGYTHPIVALTANALIGQAEMFLESGFDGFLSKPIDLRELNVLLNRQIRDKQPPEVLEAARRNKRRTAIPAQKAANEIEEFFLIDAEKTVATLEEVFPRLGEGGDADVHLYTVSVHGIKNALGIIGEAELSVFALKLEQAGRDRDIAVLRKETPAFLAALRSLIQRLKPAQALEVAVISDEDRRFLRKKMAVIKTSCAVFDKKTAKAALAELRKRSWPRGTLDILDEINMLLVDSDFIKIAGIADAVIKGPK